MQLWIQKLSVLKKINQQLFEYLDINNVKIYNLSKLTIYLPIFFEIDGTFIDKEQRVILPLGERAEKRR
jgi:hypothetical protein